MFYCATWHPPSSFRQRPFPAPPPTDKLRSCHGRATNRYGLATDNRAAHAQTKHGRKPDKQLRDDRPGSDNQPAKPRNPHPPSTAIQHRKRTFNKPTVISITYFAAQFLPSVPPHLYKCGGSRIPPCPHGLPTDGHNRKPCAQEGLFHFLCPHSRRTSPRPSSPRFLPPPETIRQNGISYLPGTITPPAATFWQAIATPPKPDFATPTNVHCL